MIPCGTPVKIIQDKRAFRLIKSGDIGSDVRNVQNALKDLLYYNGPPDGKFGAKLSQAVLEFQQENELSVSGTVDQKTYDLIMKKWKKIKYEQ